MEASDSRWADTVERWRLFTMAKDFGVWSEVGDDNSEAFLSLDTENMKHVIRELGGDPDAKS